MSSMIEVRLFGSLRVRRRDGSVVDPHEWKTSKTRDLLRILALRSGTVVPAEQLVEWLWPDVDAKKGAASLRTAVSQVRRTLGEDCVERLQSGLALNGVWVDTKAFDSLTAEARRHFAEGDLAAGVAAARQALALHVGELGEDEPYAAWLSLEREHLSIERAELLVEVAEAARRLGWYLEALAFARRAVEAEPAREAAHRVIMFTHHRLGERGLALQAYEDCREVLVERFGADPSRQTRDLHLQILADDEDDAEVVAFAGPGAEVAVPAAEVAHPARMLEAVPICAAPAEEPEHVIERARRILAPAGSGVLDAIAVLDGGATVELISATIGLDREAVVGALQQLEDLFVLDAAQDGTYAFRSPVLQQAAVSWLRPSTRRTLQERAASSRGLSLITDTGAARQPVRAAGSAA